MAELAVSIAIGGKDIADLRGTGYKGEWGEKYTMKKLLVTRLTLVSIISSIRVESFLYLLKRGI